MRLATLRHQGGTRAVRIDGDRAVDIPGFVDVGQLLRDPSWRALAAAANGAETTVPGATSTDWAPVVPAPGKIICVGLNYRAHILEMGRDLPEYPTLFAKYPEALVGASDPIVLPMHAASMVDWEAELAVVIGSTVRDVDETAAEKAIAGYSVLNDVSMRDYQNRTLQWLQGKTFEGSSPFGPVLVTPDEYSLGANIRCSLDGESVQDAATDDLVFGPAALISYISRILTLNPGDVIATGTPGGVGHARKPPRYLAAGQTLVTAVEGIGELRNPIRSGS